MSFIKGLLVWRSKTFLYKQSVFLTKSHRLRVLHKATMQRKENASRILELKLELIWLGAYLKKKLVSLFLFFQQLNKKPTCI